MKNKIVLDLGIWDFDDITHNEITEMLGIQPIKVYVKGEKRNPKNPNSPLIKKNGWRMSSPLDEYASFDDQMNAILDIIESKFDVFKVICAKYLCEFSCAIFVYHGNEDSTPSVHLDSRYNKLNKELNIEFDVDLYVYSNEED